MSKIGQWLEARGWRLYSRRKYGMYIKEHWYHPRDGAHTYNQGQAVRIEKEFQAQKKKVFTPPAE